MTVKTGRLKKRTPEAYDSRVQGRQESRKSAGDVRFNTSVARIQVIRPAGKDGFCAFMPFKHPDYEDPENNLQPGRSAAEAGAYTHWIVRIACANFIGFGDAVKHSFCLYKPGDEEGKNKCAYRKLFYAAKDAHDNGEFGNGKSWLSKWNKLLVRKKNTGQALSDPGPNFFIQGACFENGDKFYMNDGERTLPMGLAPNDPLTVFALPASASNIYDAFDVMADEFEGDAEADFSLPFTYGDPTGKFLRKKRILVKVPVIWLFNPRNKVLEAGKRGVLSTTFGGEIKNFQGYEVGIGREYKVKKEVVFNGRVETPEVNTIFARLQYWFDDKGTGQKGLIHIPTEEEKVLYIIQSFKEVPMFAKLISWAYSESDELMATLKSDDVKGILANRVTDVVPKNEKADDEDEDDDDEGDEDEAPAKKKKVKKDPTNPKAAKADEEDEDEDEEDEEDEAPAKKKAKTKPADDDEEEDEDEEEEEDDDEDEAPAKKKKKAKPADDEEEEEEEEEDEEDEEEEEDEDEAPAKKKKAKPADDDEEEDEEDEEEEEEDEDDDAAPAKKKKAKPADDDEEEDEEDEEEEEDDEEDEEDEDDEPAKPKGKKSSKADEEDEFADEPAKKGKKGTKSDSEFETLDDGAMTAVKKAGKASKKRSEKPAAEPPAKPAKKKGTKPEKAAAPAKAKPAAEKPAGKSKGGSAKRR